jgi:hypothetical protein
MGDKFKVFTRDLANRSVIIRLTSAEFVEIERIADLADLPVATVIKQLLRQTLARGIEIMQVVDSKSQPPPATGTSGT